MIRELPADRAEKEGNEWASQFQVDGPESTQEQLRGLVASAFAAGWMNGYRAGVADVKEIVDGASR